MTPRMGEGYQDREDLAKAKQDFARTVKAWFAQNGWPQKITDDWAKAGGSAIGPWASQMCGLMKGDLNPSPALFVAFAEFNQAVADQDLKNVNNSKAKERLTNAEPLRDDDGNTFTAADFFSLFVGLIDVPRRYSHVTDEEAAKLSAICVESFESHMRAQMMTRLEAWQALQPLLEGWTKKQVEAFQVVLLGERPFTGQEMTELHQKFGGQPPLDVMLKFTNK